MRLRLTVVFCAAALVAGCGVPVTGDPEVLSTTAVPYNLLQSPTPTAPATTGAETSPAPTAPTQTGQVAGEVAFVVDEQRVVLEPRAVPAGPPREVAQALLRQLEAGPTATERTRGLGSAIAAGTGLTATSIVGDLVMIDLTEETPVQAPDRLRVAVAQIVLTATSQAGVRQVLLSRAGQPVSAPLTNGSLTAKPLTRRDYESLIHG
jgi:spore germination protein GerM